MAWEPGRHRGAGRGNTEEDGRFGFMTNCKRTKKEGVRTSTYYQLYGHEALRQGCQTEREGSAIYGRRVGTLCEQFTGPKGSGQGWAHTTRGVKEGALLYISYIKTP